MLGAYDALMKTGGGGMPGQAGMQATPVHHVGKGTVNQPGGGSIKDQAMGFLGEVETELNKYRPGSHAYNNLMSIRGQLIQDLSDMDVEHQKLQEGYEGIAPIDQRMQNLKGRMLPYQRGITPEGKPVR